MRLNALVFIAILAVGPGVVRVGAQYDPLSINPEAIEFDSPVLAVPGATGYRVELFVAGSDPVRDTPVKAFDLGQGSLRSDRRLRVDLKPLVLDVADGRYIATVRALTAASTSERSRPSAAFVLVRDGTPETRVAMAKNERFWTRVGFAIAGALLALPFAF